MGATIECLIYESAILFEQFAEYRWRTHARVSTYFTRSRKLNKRYFDVYLSLSHFAFIGNIAVSPFSLGSRWTNCNELKWFQLKHSKWRDERKKKKYEWSMFVDMMQCARVCRQSDLIACICSSNLFILCISNDLYFY